MSAVGLSFGSATSGDGFDVTSTVSAIMTAQRTPETTWATRTTALQAQDTVISTLGTDLSTLSTAVSSLTSFDGVFSGKTGATSDSTKVALTDVEMGATSTTHVLSVTSIAQTAQAHTSVLATGSTLASGSISLTVGSGSAQSVSIASGASLSDVATSINGLSLGVTAAVITTSTGTELSLISSATGAASDFTVDTSSMKDSSGNVLTSTKTQTGADASYNLDGVSLTSSTNSISTALTGVTFQLVAPTTSTSSSGTTTTSSVLMEIVPDTSTVSTTMTSFVTAYNALVTAMSAQEGKDSSGNAEPLFGSTIIQQLQSSLSAALNFTGYSGTGTANTAAKALNLVSLGITTGTDGTLTLDTSTLTSALSSNLDAIATYFQSSGYFGQNFTSTLTNLGSTGNGALALAANNNSAEEATLANDKSALEARLTVYESALTTELNTANEILQAIPSTLKGITQLFDAITGNTSD